MFAYTGIRESESRKEVLIDTLNELIGEDDYQSYVDLAKQALDNLSS